MSVLPSLHPGPLGVVRELVGMPLEFARMYRGFGDAVAQCPRGDGHTVLVLPGFTATDETTLPMRRFLDRLGYRTAGWSLGWNLGIKPEDEPKLEAHVERLAADGPITIVGWSLGGVYAREVARRRPELVRRVVTMGTPIRGREGTQWVVFFFRLLNQAAGEDLTDEGAERMAQPIDAPTTAIWSSRDGVVSGHACQVREEDIGPDAENVEVDSTHLGFGFNLDVLQVLADRLSRPASLAAAS